MKKLYHLDVFTRENDLSFLSQGIGEIGFNHRTNTKRICCTNSNKQIRFHEILVHLMEHTIQHTVQNYLREVKQPVVRAILRWLYSVQGS